jgi:hypothetical protein
VGTTEVVDPRIRAGYQLVVEDDFAGDRLEPRLWFPHYLPQWSSREASAARYRLGDGVLRLLVEEDQPAWCPDLDGQLRVSSLQTGVRAGPSGAGRGSTASTRTPSSGRHSRNSGCSSLGTASSSSGPGSATTPAAWPRSG